MAVVIRLNIRGRKHLAFHKIIVADSRAPRDGRHIEILGHYDPLAKPPVPTVVIDKERVAYWLAQGALPSEQVASLLKQVGVVRPVKQSQPKKKKELTAEQKKARKASNANKAARTKAKLKASAERKAAKPKKKAVKKADKKK